MPKEIKGQMSLFDFIDKPKKRRPCDYRFKRYIGQKVRFRDRKGIYRITDIFPYYTYIINWKGEELVGTPYDIWPVDRSEEED